jgi:hypothetical protein
MVIFHSYVSLPEGRFGLWIPALQDFFPRQWSTIENTENFHFGWRDPHLAVG